MSYILKVGIIMDIIKRRKHVTILETALENVLTICYSIHMLFYVARYFDELKQWFEVSVLTATESHWILVMSINQPHGNANVLSRFAQTAIFFGQSGRFR